MGGGVEEMGSGVRGSGNVCLSERVVGGGVEEMGSGGSGNVCISERVMEEGWVPETFCDNFNLLSLRSSPSPPQSTHPHHPSSPTCKSVTQLIKCEAICQSTCV